MVELHRGQRAIGAWMFTHDPPDSSDDPDPTTYYVKEHELTPEEIKMLADYEDLEIWCWLTFGHGATDGLRFTAASLFIE